MSFNLQNTVYASGPITIANGSTFGSTNLTALTGTGVSLSIDGSQLTGTVTCRLNGQAQNGTITIYKGQSYNFGYLDVQVASIDWANSSGSSQTIQFVFGVVHP